MTAKYWGASGYFWDLYFWSALYFTCYTSENIVRWLKQKMSKENDHMFFFQKRQKKGEMIQNEAKYCLLLSPCHRPTTFRCEFSSRLQSHTPKLTILSLLPLKSRKRVHIWPKNLNPVQNIGFVFVLGTIRPPFVVITEFNCNIMHYCWPYQPCRLFNWAKKSP